MMIRRAIYLLTMVAMVSMIGCQSSIPKSETVVRHGIVYKMGDQDPFTGIVEGRGREGYRNKSLRYKKRYKDGLLDGMCEFWYPNGKLESQVPYRNGQINGIVCRYHENGQLKARIPIRNGLRGGSSGEFFWDKDGNLLEG